MIGSRIGWFWWMIISSTNRRSNFSKPSFFSQRFKPMNDVCSDYEGSLMKNKPYGAIIPLVGYAKSNGPAASRRLPTMELL